MFLYVASMHLQQPDHHKLSLLWHPDRRAGGGFGVAAAEMPLPQDGDYPGELARLRAVSPQSFLLGYSRDWGATSSLLASGDAWYSVVAGLLPDQALRLTRAAMAGRKAEAAGPDAAFRLLWELFRAHGSSRVMYCCGRLARAFRGQAPPLPLRRVGLEHEHSLIEALDVAQAIGPTPVS